MKEYFKLLKEIKEKSIEVNKLYLLSCINNDYEEEKIEIMNYCYDVWLDADADMSLARLADIVQDHWDEIQKDEITSEEIIEECLDI
ncbi:MAG: hypothetical protein ACI31S_01385 [Bacilli bacterium]